MAFCRGCLLSTKGEVKDISHLNFAVEGLQNNVDYDPADVIFGQKPWEAFRKPVTTITCIPSFPVPSFSHSFVVIF